jgi:asparagine synthase (glutamine-hydrolysing)
MAHSLEARVPFLDNEYLRILESIPGRDRVPLFGGRKPLQMRLARAILPKPLFSRLRRSTSPFRRKHGFDVPIGQWMRSRKAGSLEEFVGGASACLPVFLDSPRVRETIRAFVSGSDASYRFPLSLVVLEMWLRTTFAGVSPHSIAASLPGESEA